MALFPDLPITSIAKQPASSVRKSGPFRVRKIATGMPKTVNVTWQLNEEENDEWEAFFETDIDSGALPFTINLPKVSTVGSSDFLREHEAIIVPDSVNSTLVNHMNFTVTATLEVKI